MLKSKAVLQRVLAEVAEVFWVDRVDRHLQKEWEKNNITGVRNEEKLIGREKGGEWEAVLDSSTLQPLQKTSGRPKKKDMMTTFITY